MNLTYPLPNPRAAVVAATTAVICLAAGLASASATAQIPSVQNAWVRATVPGQNGTGAFMTITATSSMQLVSVSTPAAGVAEMHEMKMNGDVMSMRALPALDLPAGQPVALKPGSNHLMLMDLKQPLRPGASVPITLVFKDTAGRERKLVVNAPVQTAAR